MMGEFSFSALVGQEFTNRYSLAAPRPSSLNLSVTLVNFRNACIHMNIILFFHKGKKNIKEQEKGVFKPANMPVKTLNV